MRVRLPVLAASLFLSACALPRPVVDDVYTAGCPKIAAKPSPTSTLFITVRLPDCRVGPVKPTNLRSDEIRYASMEAGRVQFHDPKVWAEEVKRRLAAGPGNSLVLYVHGYDNNDADALGRAAKIQYALGSGHLVIAFTWPSYHRKTAYFWDEANAEWAQTLLPVALAPLLNVTRSITLVAHSMGNRLALAEVAWLREKGQLGKIDQLIMAAPDVDRQGLARELSPPEGVGVTPTIYVSLRDQALSSSWRGHGYARAGDFSDWVTGRQPYFVFDGRLADVVDLTGVDHSPIGHSAFVDTVAGLADLCRVISRSPGRAIEDLPGTHANYVHLLGEGPDDACRANAALALARPH